MGSSNRRTVGLVTFCLDRFRNTTSIMADEEAAEEATGLAKYAPSGEVDQYGFPIIPKGKRTPIKVLGSKLSNILKSKEQMDIEKQNIILSRIAPFGIEGLDYAGLCE